MQRKITSNFEYGFTLAEVLITLVIIGIVAALTIPTAINKYKDQELKTQFRQAYSTILQAMYKTEMNDFAGFVPCFYGDGRLLGQNYWDCGSFFNSLAKNLQVHKICRGNAKADGCIPTYTHPAAYGCAGFTVSAIETGSTVYVLNNGQILICYGTCGPLFLFDINGQKGPNIWGKDLFDFMIQRNENSGIYTRRRSCSYNDPSGKTTEEMIQYALAGKK